MRKVMVIDDEHVQLSGIIRNTNWKKFDCEIAGSSDNVRDALEMAKAIRPDIIVTDIKMPGQSGLDLIRAISQVFICEFIVISGYSEFSFAKEALTLGVRHYLLKPIDDAELEDALDDVSRRITIRKQQEHLHPRDDNAAYAETISCYRRSGSEKLDKYTAKALRYIWDNCHSNLTVQDIADYLNISQSYFWKLFNTNMSCTFLDYMTECRIQKAVKLLENETIKIYEISAACGYKDTRYFSSVFKKTTGLTPVEYRKKL